MTNLTTALNDRLTETKTNIYNDVLVDLRNEFNAAISPIIAKCFELEEWYDSDRPGMIDPIGLQEILEEEFKEVFELRLDERTR